MIKDIIKTDNVIRCTIDLENIGEFRVLWEDGHVFFCAKDVCRVFNIQDYRTCVNKYCKKVQRFYHETDVGIRKMNFVDFIDIMRLFEHSKLSNAVDLLFQFAIIVDTFNQAYKDAVESDKVTDDTGNDECKKEKFDDGENIDDDYDYCSDCEYRAVCDCDGDCDNCDVCDSESRDDCSDDCTEHYECNGECDNSDDEFECDGDCDNCDEYYDCEVSMSERNQSTEKAVAKIIKGVSMILESVEKLLQNSSESEESEIA